jgi:signal transduction histidine kinase/CHASE1-domain containing sensor protein
MGPDRRSFMHRMDGTVAFARGVLRGQAAALVVLLTGTAVALGAAGYVSRVVAAQQVARFRELVGASDATVRLRMDAYIAKLRSARGLFEVIDRDPTREEFRRYVGSFELARFYPGIQGIGWSKALTPDELPAHEAEMRVVGAPEYRVWPEGERELYSSIVHLEPLDWRNQRAIGYDMYSDPTRRAAMDRARDTAEAAATARVELVQEAGAQRQAGFLVYVAVFERPPRSAEERRALLRGWVYAPFRAADLLNGTIGTQAAQAMGLSVFDGEEMGPDALLYDAGVTGPVQVSAVRRVEVAGRTWTLHYAATRGFATRTERVLPGAVLGLGLVLASLLFWVVREDAKARRRAERAALRASLLADAGKTLATSTEYARTLPDVAALAAERVADACLVHLTHGATPAWIVGHRDGEVAARVAETLSGAGLDDADLLGAAAAMRRAEPQVRALERRRLAANGMPVATAARALGARMSLAVPLSGRGQTLGVVVLLRSRGRFAPDDVRLGEDLARVVSATIENARLHERAQEAVAARDEFLSIASHELKTPLTSLVLHADSLRAAARRGQVEQVGRKAEVIRRNVDRLSRLVTSLLDISRISAGRLDLEIEEVDLAEVARDVAARFEDEARRAGCTIRIKADEPVVGRWDRMRIDQVATNLLSNALKYGAGKPVEMVVEGDGPRAILSVRDHGIGISEEDQRRIFQRFERAVSKRNYGGFGLGLWIVRQIVESLGGRVRVQSAPGGGSLFTVELRRGAEGVDVAAPADGGEREAGGDPPSATRTP